jgi:uncharacterized membrane protein (DUF485 family)
MSHFENNNRAHEELTIMQSPVFVPGQSQYHQPITHQQTYQTPIQTPPPPSSSFNSMQSAFFPASSHIVIMLSLAIFVVVSALMSEGEFDRGVSLSLGLVLLIYFFTSPIISFFSGFLVSFHGGNSGAAIIGSILGFIISIVLGGLLIVLAAGGEFTDITEELPTSSTEGSVLDFIPLIVLQAFASGGAVFLSKIGRK